MRIYLVQHGVCTASGEGGEKVLTDQGKEETSLIATVAKGYRIPVSAVLHSGKVRAEQTAAIFHEVLEVMGPLQSISGIKPLDDVKNFAATIPSLDKHMIVGHLPFMEKLVSYLTADREEIKVYQFQNSGIVCLAGDEMEQGRLNWYILWTLNPGIK